MSKNVLLISRHESRSSYDTPESMREGLQQAAGEEAITYTASSYEDLLFRFDGKELTVTDTLGGRDVRDFDGIFLFGWYKDPMQQDIAFCLALYAEAHGVPFLNAEAKSRSRTKLSQYVLAALNNVSITPFVFVQQAHKMRQAAEATGLAYPFIVKSARGSKGANNYLVRDAAAFDAAMQANADMNFVAQTFVPNDGDYRILVMGGKVRLAMLRRAQGDTHLNNTSQGGSAEIVPLESLDAAMLAESVKVAALVRREVTGVDMIVHKETGKYYLLEVNNMPQLSTGSLVPEKLAVLDAYLREWIGA
jgi:glutathione synthase/RimK-type ligase-like ATP-grasp enzyme